MSNSCFISFDDFLKVDIHVGTILSVRRNPKAIKSSYVLDVDFGDIGLRTSSAQITENYRAEELIGRQIVAVMNFPPKLVAGIRSDILVLGAICQEEGTVLLTPPTAVSNGTRIL